MGIMMLVATTTIESGLDISNANTMIINDAQNYALNVCDWKGGRNKRHFAIYGSFD